MSTADIRKELATKGYHLSPQTYAGTYRGWLVTRRKWIIYEVASGRTVIDNQKNPAQAFARFKQFEKTRQPQDG